MNYRALFVPIFILALAYFISSGPQSSRAASSVAQTFYRDLKLGDSGMDVLALQKILNRSGIIIATTGPGSPENETSLFGAKTKNAVIRFQEQYRDEILSPSGLQRGTGYVGAKTRNLLLKKHAELQTTLQQNQTLPAVTSPTNSTPFATSSTIMIYYPSAYESYPGKTVTLNGVGFTANGNILIFSKNGKRVHSITNIASSTGTSLAFRVPNLDNDRYDINLTNPNGTSRSMSFLVILDSASPRKVPRITSISPSSVEYGTPVTLYGENLVATENYLISNYGIVENATSSPDNTSITFTLKPFEDIPQIKAGTAPKQNVSIPVFVHLVNKNGVSDTKNPGTFTIQL